MPNLSDRLAQGGVVLLDGATISELDRRGVPRSHETASAATANLNSLDDVKALHRAYIDAGAEVISTNTFGVGRVEMRAAGLEDRLEEIIRAAVSAALDARAETNRPDVAVAGSIACITQQGSLLGSYDEIAYILADAGVDLIALEMVNTVADGADAVAAVKAIGLPVWLGVSAVVAPDGRLVTVAEPGEDLRSDVAAFAELGVDALTVMHTEMDDVEAVLAMINEEFDGPVGAYPHRGTWEPPVWHHDQPIDPDEFAAAALSWVDQGAQIVGGCCGIGTAHIAAIHQALGRSPVAQVP